MLDIFLIRHAESEFNAQPIVQGRSDGVPLSDLGVEQAKKLGERRKVAGWEYDLVFCSVSERAKQTALYALADYAPIYSDEIVEISRGEWEGKSHEEVGWYGIHNDESEFMTFKAPGGESLEDVKKRAANWYKKELKQFEGQTKK